MGDTAPLPLVLIGQVDHGKTTLLGRLLHELGALPAGKTEELAALSAKRGAPLEWSFALDGLQAERDQAITLDATRVRLRTPSREFVIIDAPGHAELIKNMIGAASGAKAALLLVDVQSGSEEQTLRHLRILQLLGVRDLVVAVNKMDLVGYDEGAFRQRESELRNILARSSLTIRAIVPISAREGANLRARGAIPSWYDGGTLVEAMDTLEPERNETAGPLRIPVQDIYRFDSQRVIAGRIESGKLSVGDELLFSPSGHTARVTGLQAWPGDPPVQSSTGENVGMVLDRAVLVERGDVVSHIDLAPKLSPVFDANIFWLARKPLSVGSELSMQHALRTVRVRTQSIRHRIDVATARPQPASSIAAGEFARVTLRSDALIATDDFSAIPEMGRFVLRDGFVTVGCGIIDASGYPDRRAAPQPRRELTSIRHQVGEHERAARFGHAGAVVWMTGLSAAGKSTLAMLLERRLFDAGYAAFVLDGDNVRRGLNANLGFSPADREENIRRVGEVAALFAEAGIVCITAFISPYRDDRRTARAAVAKGRFLEVYVRADLEVCEARDPKGLYRRAREGKIRDFTGIDSPYEEPEAPELIVDTTEHDVAECVDMLVEFVTSRCHV